MNDRHNLLDTITNAFVPIHRDGYKFVAGAAILTLILFMVAAPLGWLGALFTAACAYFFRDPDRVTPDRPGLIVSAADGKIASVADDVTAPRELALGTAPLTRVSVFLSVPRRSYRSRAHRRKDHPQYLCARRIFERGARQGERRE